MIDLFYSRPASALSTVSLASNYSTYAESVSKKLPPGVPKRLSFEKIINGETCFPCRTIDFMAYCHFVERSAENLKFYLWYQAYVRRFEALHEMEQRLSPPWTDSAAATLRAGVAAVGYNAANSNKAAALLGLSLATSGPLPLRAAELRAISVQPFRTELNQITALFLHAGAPMELNLSSRDRSTVLHALNATTHPSALLPVVKSAEHALRSQSHPNFIRRQISNANPQRTASYNIIGYSLLVLSLICAVLLVLSGANRGWRVLPAWGFAVAAGHIFSGNRGFCCRLFTRNGQRNLEPWQSYEEYEDLIAISKLPDSEESTPSSSRNPSKDMGLSPIKQADVRITIDLEGGDKFRAMTPYTPGDWSFEDSIKYEKQGDENVQNFHTKGLFVRLHEKGVPVLEPALKDIHRILFTQAVTLGFVVWGCMGAILIPLPKFGYM